MTTTAFQTDFGRSVSVVTDYERDTGARLVFCYANRTVVEHSPGRPHHVARAVGRTACEPHGLAVADYIFGVPRPPRFTWGMLGSCTLMARRGTFLTSVRSTRVPGAAQSGTWQCVAPCWARISSQSTGRW